MKLVEILARELEVWPEGALVLSQLENGYICKPGESSFDEPITVAYYDLAEDWSSAVVTRPQWQAERDRMSKMEALIEARDNPPSTEPTYEQQLWDRVAKELFAEWSSPAVSLKSASIHAATAMNFADAFMAEREKRMKGAA